MQAEQTINVKGLEHDQREKMIFGGVEKLGVGKTAKLIVEFNPLPLVFMLKSGGEFNIAYEKEGPEEWVLDITRVNEASDKRGHLKRLLHELSQGEVSPQAKEQAKDFFNAVDAKTLGDLEQELIREGVSHDQIRQSLCDIHLEVMRDSLVANRLEVSAPHPVHTLMEEHKVILQSLNNLDAVVSRVKQAERYDDLIRELEILEDISHHLVEAENHHLREEEVLFPVLERHDVIEPPSIMKMDHVEFRKAKRELFQLSHNYWTYEFSLFKNRVVELGEYLSRELSGHIFKEDNILYQIALQVLTPEEWEEIKVGCDRIGYCCFTPDDVAKPRKTVNLDLRPLPPFQRHEKIMKIWNDLKPGETLRITNDHDPKPLRYQFEAEYPQVHSWEYEQNGPSDWVVKISRK
jgi:uncharacterized protein (DUF2249 family)/hemerythrin-like domain-containing protein